MKDNSLNGAYSISNTEFPPIRTKQAAVANDWGHQNQSQFSVRRSSQGMEQSESTRNLAPAPRIEPRNDSTKASKLSGASRPSKPQKLSKSKKQTRSTTPREHYAGVMKEIAVTKAVINQMLAYDDRKRGPAAPGFGSEEKAGRRSKKEMRQVSSNRQLVTTHKLPLDFEDRSDGPGQDELRPTPETPTRQQPETPGRQLPQLRFDLAMQNDASDLLGSIDVQTPEKTEPSEDSDDDQSDNTYADDIFDDCGATPKGPAPEVRDEEEESSPDGAVIVLNYQELGDQASPRNARGKGSDGAPNPKKGFEQATPVVTSTTPLEGTPFKEGDKGRVLAYEP